MKKYKVLCLFAILPLLVLPFVSLAAYNDYVTDSDTTVYLVDIDANITVDSGAAVVSMTVYGSYISLSMASGSAITLRSAEKRSFSVDGVSGTSSTGCNGTESTAVITATGDCAVTVNVGSQSNSCSTGASTGGGSSSAAPTIVTPTNPVISVNSDAVITRARAVNISLSATNAAEMMISENSNFTNGSWTTYAVSATFTLSEGLGNKTVYVKYKSSTGGISTVVSDTIELVSSLPDVATQPITPATGGSVVLSDNSAAVSFPAYAVSANATISITPTETYNAPVITQGVAGNKAFEFKAEMGGATVANFAKNLTLTFKYSDSDIAEIKEGTLKVYYWDTALSKWVSIGGTVDAVNNTITATVNHFTLFMVIGDKKLGTGDLIKLECNSSNKTICSAVYYLAKNGKRYVFPNEKIFFTWYADFSTVKIVSAEQLASYVIGGNATYRPGTKMIKIDTDPKVYAVEKGGKLRWVKTEAVAIALYGSNWNRMIDDLPDSFFFNYTIGTEIVVGGDYAKTAATNASPDINTDKGL